LRRFAVSSSRRWRRCQASARRRAQRQSWQRIAPPACGRCCR
jgi:hypothetical protein